MAAGRWPLTVLALGLAAFLLPAAPAQAQVRSSSFGGPRANARDVQTCGAIGDGITDDTDAIAACWDLAAGGPIYYPAGRYVDAGSHTLTSGQIVTGDGARISVILSRSPESVFNVGSSSYWSLRDLSIVGGGTGIAITAESGWGMIGTVTGVEISDTDGDGVLVAGAWNLAFRQVRVSCAGGAGFRVRKSLRVNPAHISFDTCRADYNRGPGFTVTTPDAPPTILGIDWIACTATFNSIGYDLANVVDASWLQSYSAGDSTGIGVRLLNVQGATFIGGGFHTETTGIDATASALTITGTYFNDNRQHVWLRGGSRGSWQGCYLGKADVTVRRESAGAWETR